MNMFHVFGLKSPGGWQAACIDAFSNELRPSQPRIDDAYWTNRPSSASNFDQSGLGALDEVTDLTCAEAAGAKHMATLDGVLSRNAQRLKIKPVVLRSTS
jgi:hypothetical protein